MRYWWVNQNQTYRFEVPGGFLWSPKTKSDGGKNYFYDTMEQVRPGDVVFSFADTYIKAIGIVQEMAVTTPKPDFRTAGSNWSDTGWFVAVEFDILDAPIRPKDFMDQIGPLLADKYAPLQANGNGLQGVYLTEVSAALGTLLLQLSNAALPTLQDALTSATNPDDADAIDHEIQLKHLEGDLVGIQLVKARRGQGIFKANVRLVEKACRVTGVTDVRHLRASHIKPWRKSTNDEKLDGYNGLLLSPHVDHLFDQGFISFGDTGSILVSSKLKPSVLQRWSLDPARSVGSFNTHQREYLEYHRDVILQP